MSLQVRWAFLPHIRIKAHVDFHDLRVQSLDAAGKSATHLRHRYRTGGGLSMLKAAGHVDSPSRGVWRITPRGRDLLNQHPTGFDDETGRQLVKESRAQVRLASTPDWVPSAGAEPAIPLSPDERIDAPVEEIRGGVAAELLLGCRPRSSRAAFSTCCMPLATARARRTFNVSALRVTVASMASSHSTASASSPGRGR